MPQTWPGGPSKPSSCGWQVVKERETHPEQSRKQHPPCSSGETPSPGQTEATGPLSVTTAEEVLPTATPPPASEGLPPLVPSEPSLAFPLLSRAHFPGVLPPAGRLLLSSVPCPACQWEGRELPSPHPAQGPDPGPCLSPNLTPSPLSAGEPAPVKTLVDCSIRTLDDKLEDQRLCVVAPLSKHRSHMLTFHGVPASSCGGSRSGPIMDIPTALGEASLILESA